MWKKAHIFCLIIIYRQIIFRNNLILRGPGKISQVRIFDRKFIRHIVQDKSWHCLLSSGQIIIFIFYGERPEFFSNFGWPDYLFYLQKLPDLPDQLVVPKINQEIIEPSYEMVGVKKRWQIMDKIIVFLALFLALLALQRNLFMYVLPYRSVYSKNWTKTLKSVIMNDTGPIWGNRNRTTKVSHVQTV
jgi:hypothetical protein